VRERFHERWRDKTRDDIAKALNSLGLRAGMAERGRPEEEVCKRTFTRSIGVIDIAEGPFRWVNIVKQDGNQYSPTRWWTVFCLPDEERDDNPDDLRYVDNRQAVDIKTSREKSFPLFGRVTAVTEEGAEEHIEKLGRRFTAPGEQQLLAQFRVADAPRLLVRIAAERLGGWGPWLTEQGGTTE